MAIRGSLSEASLADVLQLLAIGCKTGCLSVSDRTRFARIYFDRGLVTYASLVNRKDRLGDLLVKNGLVSPEDLAAALEQQTGQDSPRLGEILVRRGAVTAAEVEKYVRIQIEEAIYLLFTWTHGVFHFEPDLAPEPGDLVTAIHPETLLLEGARRVDEWAVIEKKIPTLDLVFSREATPPELDGDLTPEQSRILALVDGRRTVREIVDAAGLLEFDACKALFGLIQAGYARESGRRRSEEAPPAVDPDELRTLGLNFLHARMFDEAEREFRAMLEADAESLDAHFCLASLDLSRGAFGSAVRRLRSLLERAPTPATFHNLALALEAGGRLERALLVAEAGLREAPRHAPLLLSRAVLMAKLRRPREAVAAFDAYDRTVGAARSQPAIYFAYSAVALAAAGRLTEALDRAETGLSRFPHNAVLLAHAGAIHERLGDGRRAGELYMRAVEEDGALPQAIRGLADARYRGDAPGDAAPLYAALLDRDLGDGEICFRLGTIAYRRGDRDPALRFWRQALMLDANHAAARTNLELVGEVAPK